MSAAQLQHKRPEAYQQRVEDVLLTLGTDAQRGLTTAEAQTRLERLGANRLTAKKRVPAWRKFLAQFRDVLVILLLLATLISVGLWLYERESALPYEALAIFAVVLLNAVMGYMQQSRAEHAVAALRQMSAAHASVMRDGLRQEVPATAIVPGDVILIEEGDTIPADARLIRSTALQTAEGALTGQSGGVIVLPLLATQLLWINLLTDGAPALALGVDPADADVMHAPPRPRNERVITPHMWVGIVSIGIVMAAGTLFVLDASLSGGLIHGAGTLQYAQTMAFTTLVFFSLFTVFNARSDELSAVNCPNSGIQPLSFRHRVSGILTGAWARRTPQISGDPKPSRAASCAEYRRNMHA